MRAHPLTGFSSTANIEGHEGFSQIPSLTGGPVLFVRAKIFLAFFEESLLMMPILNEEPFRSGVPVTLINSFLIGRKEKVLK